MTARTAQPCRRLVRQSYLWGMRGSARLPSVGPMVFRRVLPRVIGAVATAGVVAVLGNVGAAGAASGPPSAAGSSTAGVEARYVVRYAPGTDMSATARTLRADGVAVGRTFTRAIDGAVVTLTAGEAAALVRSPGVLSVERDVTFTVADTQPNPTWGLDRIDQRTLPLSATFTTPAAATPVNAYVIDTGTAPTHVDLANRVQAGFSAIDTGPGNTDCNGHGTHVAGTLAGSTYGVAKTATVIPVRVLDCTGTGFLSEVVAGIDWVVGQHQPGVPAVANLSLSGLANPTIDAAMNALIADGVTAAVAAGNEATDACTRSPAGVDAALTVAASNLADQQATFSNIGSCVDLYAPGVDITSIWPTTPDATLTISGTSMSAPHVAGTAAVLLSVQPGLTPAQVSDKLLADATVDVLTGTSPDTVNRLLFLDQYATPPPSTPPPPPAAPVQLKVPREAGSVDAAPRSRSARVSWKVRADGGSAITEQRIRVYHRGDKIRTVTVPPGDDDKRIKRLEPGEPYRFTVTLVNAIGKSPESDKSRAVRPRR